MIFRSVLSVCLGLLTLQGWAQSSLLPYDEHDYRMIQRLEIKSKRLSPFFHSTVAPFAREDVARFADSFVLQGNPVTFKDFRYLNEMQIDNPEWSGSQSGKRRPILWFFYPQRSGFFYHADKDF